MMLVFRLLIHSVALRSYLADMLCEAVPRALLPRMHSPKQRVTRGESLSHVTGYNATQE